jgi:hypothetical protein
MTTPRRGWFVVARASTVLRGVDRLELAEAAEPPSPPRRGPIGRRLRGVIKAFLRPATRRGIPRIADALHGRVTHDVHQQVLGDLAPLRRELEKEIDAARRPFEVHRGAPRRRDARHHPDAPRRDVCAVGDAARRRLRHRPRRRAPRRRGALHRAAQQGQRPGPFRADVARGVGCERRHGATPATARPGARAVRLCRPSKGASAARTTRSWAPSGSATGTCSPAPGASSTSAAAEGSCCRRSPSPASTRSPSTSIPGWWPRRRGRVWT